MEGRMTRRCHATECRPCRGRRSRAAPVAGIASSVRHERRSHAFQRRRGRRHRGDQVLEAVGISEADVARQAIAAALDDAGLTLDDVDGVCLYDIESTTIGDLAPVLGLQNVRFFSTHSHGGGAYCAVIDGAAAALEADHASVVLTFRARNRGRTRVRQGLHGGRAAVGEDRAAHRRRQWHEPFGVASPAQEMALIARRHMLATAPPQSSSARWRGACAATPCATRGRSCASRMTLADHQASRNVAEPLRLLDCCSRTTAAARSWSRRSSARGTCASRPAYVVARPSASAPRTTTPHDWFRFERRRWVMAAAERLWSDAGASPTTWTPRCSTTTSRRWCCSRWSTGGSAGSARAGRSRRRRHALARRWPAREHARGSALGGVHPRLQQPHRSGAPAPRHVDLPSAGRGAGVRRGGVERPVRALVLGR